MKKFHVVKHSGYFRVYSSRGQFLEGRINCFHCFENAYSFFRYRSSFLGWEYCWLDFVDYDFSSHLLFIVDRDRGF